MEVKNYVRPLTLEEAYNLLTASGQNALLGGGVWMKYANRKVDTMIDLSLLGLNQIIEKKDEVIIGAQTTLRDLEIHPAIKNLGTGFLSQAIGSIVGVAFRNVATIGGSIAGKYPFSDLITPLLCLDVTLKFFPDEDMTLSEYLDQKHKHPGILTYIIIKKTKGKGYFKKVSNTILDFSILNVACYYNNKFMIAIGSRPAKPILATHVMHVLNQSSHLSDEFISSAGDEIIKTIPFSSDDRGSKAYREILAKTYVIRGIKEVIKP